MATAVIMPKQGQSVESCIITKWFKGKGDKVTTGEILFSYETDKAAFDLESPAGGQLIDIFYTEGSEVPVLANVAVIGEAGESAEGFLTGPSQKDESPAAAAGSEAVMSKAETAILTGSDNTSDNNDKRIRISPRARKLASEKGVEISSIAGSGPNGRIIVSDIEKIKTTAQASAIVYPGDGSAYSEKPLSNVRKLIAKAMHSSLQNSAQLTHHMSADVRKVLEAREKIKTGLKDGTEKQDITINDMICWCVIRALEKFPEVNSHFLGDSIRTFSKVSLGLAVDTSRGLMVPTVINADGYHIRQLSAELKMAAESCKKGNINPELLQSTAASFTVSNLGNYGVEMFTPVINLPQVAILGVCTIIHRPADLGNKTFGFIPFIGLSLTYDHRAVDGGPATLFLKEIKSQIENFNL
jgi:pyruvate dehydrogenase E2 component (dihydrolipoamide acetyltransferase)